MTRDLPQALADWLSAGGARIGQVALRRVPEGIEIRHIDDDPSRDLKSLASPEEVRALVNFDADGAFRPLKTAPNLRRGWRTVIPDAGALRQALESIYPAMSGVWLSHQRGELIPVSFRETLARQTGMYRVTQKINDGEARTLIERVCGGCLKCRLWDGETPRLVANEMPLLCHEACNLLVARAREVVKARPE